MKQQSLVLQKNFLPNVAFRRESSMECNTIKEALEDLRNGKIILVTDDEDRENEGDFI